MQRKLYLISTEEFGPYSHSMRGGRTNTSSDRFEALLDIHDKTTLYWRCIDPISVLVEHLQAPCVILREEREKSSGILMRTDALGLRRCLRIPNELESIHITLEFLESSGRQREAFGDKAQKCRVESGTSDNIFVDQLFSTGIFGVLII